jgi:hypothetical protein
MSRGFAVAQHLLAEVEPFHDARSEVLDQHVALPDRRSSSSRPRVDLRFSVMVRLFALSIANGIAAPLAPERLRRCSPPGGSILITSAPAWASKERGVTGAVVHTCLGGSNP